MFLSIPAVFFLLIFLYSVCKDNADKKISKENFYDEYNVMDD